MNVSIPQRFNLEITTPFSEVDRLGAEGGVKKRLLPPHTDKNKITQDAQFI